jgi:hypothetical protein
MHHNIEAFVKLHHHVVHFSRSLLGVGFDGGICPWIGDEWERGKGVGDPGIVVWSSRMPSHFILVLPHFWNFGTMSISMTVPSFKDKRWDLTLLTTTVVSSSMNHYSTFNFNFTEYRIRCTHTTHSRGVLLKLLKLYKKLIHVLFILKLIVLHAVSPLVLGTPSVLTGTCNYLYVLLYYRITCTIINLFLYLKLHLCVTCAWCSTTCTRYSLLVYLRFLHVESNSTLPPQ